MMLACRQSVLPGVIVLVVESYLIVYSYEFSNFKVTKFRLLEACITVRPQSNMLA